MSKYEIKNNLVEENTTNNIMEMKAVIKSLNFISDILINKRKDLKITLLTDSRYVKDGICLWIKNWKKNSWKDSQNKLIKNIDLWKYLDYIFEELKLKCVFPIQIEWVKSHDKNDFNNYVDLLAKYSVDSQK